METKRLAGMEVSIHEKVEMEIDTPLATLYEETAGTSLKDRSTGLHNKAFVKKYLAMEIKRAHRQRYPFGLMKIDIDDFKKINDRFGSLSGNLIIKDLAQIIKKNIREVDLSARYGGDEFVVILPYTDQTETVQVFERIQKAVACYWQSKKTLLQQGPLTLSFGVAFFPNQGTTVGELIRKADLALYRSKQEGKNRYTFYNGLLDLGEKR